MTSQKRYMQFLFLDGVNIFEGKTHCKRKHVTNPRVLRTRLEVIFTEEKRNSYPSKRKTLSIFQSLPLCCLPQLHCIEHFSHASCCVLRSATYDQVLEVRKCSSPSLSSPRGSVVHSVSTRTQKSRNSGLWVLSSRCLFKEFSAAYFFHSHKQKAWAFRQHRYSIFTLAQVVPTTISFQTKRPPD